MTEDVFEFLRPTKTAVNNKPVDSLQPVYRLYGNKVDKIFTIQDSKATIIDTVESELYFYNVYNLKITINDAIRQVGTNQRFRIIKIFFRIDHVLIWIAESDTQ
jgi:hypothetical protein